MNCEDQLGIQTLTIARLTKERDEALSQRDEALSQRDEARRIACELKTTNQQGRYSFAIIMGWDCFEKETT